MKLIYTFIIYLNFLQLITSSSDEGPSSDNVSPKKQLMRFYRRDFNLLTGEICLKLKDISEEILQDENVAQSSQRLIQEFHKNMSDFNAIYPFYDRYQLNEALARTFSDMVAVYYYPQRNANKDARYIRQLLRKLGYDEIREKYKTEMHNFYTEKFIPKFEKLKKDISSKSQLETFTNRFLKCMDKSNECEDYECYLNTFRNNCLKIQDQFVGNLQRYFMNRVMLFLHSVKVLYAKALQDPRISRISPEVRAKLQEISEYKYEYMIPFEHIFHIADIDPLDSFNSTLSSQKEAKLLRKIFVENGYEQFSAETLIKDLLDYLVKEAERFKDIYNQEDLEKEMPFSEIISHLDSSTTQRERSAALMSLEFSNVLKNGKFNKC